MIKQTIVTSKKLGLVIGLAIFVIFACFITYLVVQNVQIRKELKETEKLLNRISETDLRNYEKLDASITKKIDSLRIATRQEIKSLHHKTNKELREIAND
jgi:sensor histidine kinase YesM